ncbi:NAD-dependent malic enzyme [hydrothermal vent metagenome]|uniref:NAD-dependent malic enzyme n=1 Tax=hydrothermal vent metagenome TaxID=652676 RepID=A0A3B1CSQ7_9ZZZZ
MRYSIQRGKDGEPFVEIDESGADILHNPFLNKGTAFSKEEREELGLRGLLPPHVSTMDEQLHRVYENYSLKSNNIEKYIFLRALQDRNETLFYALVEQRLEEMTPIIYTPTVGEAVQKGSHIYRHSRGLYLSPENIDSISDMAKSLPSRDIEIIVATDNQGILGIGDQGIGGMGIPIGKLSLYTVGAGVAPQACLPICLDVGTDNKALLNDPLYLGHKHPRYTGEKYNAFIDKFVSKVKEHFPKALLQWEDFSKQKAFSNLDRYRGNILSFNDDIQGTGAVALAGVIGAMRIKRERLEDQRLCIFGAGAGGVGVARQMKSALIHRGLTKDEAGARIFVVDSQGLVMDDRKTMDDYKHDLATKRELTKNWDVSNHEHITLKETIDNAGVTILLGLSGQPGAFTEDVVKAINNNCLQPVIFPLSNPTTKVEAQPADIYKWTRGRAIVATGSPFGDVIYDGKKYTIGQGNNVFIFPGIGLGAMAAGATSITNDMFTSAAFCLADFTPQDARITNCVFPSVTELNKVSRHVALAVFETAVKNGVANPPEGEDPMELIIKKMWRPAYLPYHLAK